MADSFLDKVTRRIGQVVEPYNYPARAVAPASLSKVKIGLV